MSEPIVLREETDLGRYRPYPDYKDSGVDWVREIPANWETKRLKLVAPLSGMHANKIPSDLPYVGLEHIESWMGNLISGVESIEVDSTASNFRPGDVLFGKLRPYLAKVLRPDFIGACSSELVVFSCLDELYPSFLFYQMLNRGFVQYIDSMSYGTKMPRTSPEQLGNTRVTVAPKKDQQAIANFLDQKTAAIDKLIAKKERLIELLEEKRAAVITQAVTKGLDAAVPMKDSGVEWLGEIPEHWEVRDIKTMSFIQTGLTLGKRYTSTHLLTRPYLRVANVQDGYLDLEDIATIRLPEINIKQFELQPLDVVVTEGGDFDKLGRGYVWENQIPGCLHQNHIFAVRSNLSLLNPHYLAAVTTSKYGRAYFTATSKQSTNLASTNSKKLKKFRIPVPDMQEQSEIINSLSNFTTIIDQTINLLNTGINRQKEYRTALISTAVTGKIDVRQI